VTMVARMKPAGLDVDEVAEMNTSATDHNNASGPRTISKDCEKLPVMFRLYRLFKSMVSNLL